MAGSIFIKRALTQQARGAESFSMLGPIRGTQNLPEDLRPKPMSAAPQGLPRVMAETVLGRQGAAAADYMDQGMGAMAHTATVGYGKKGVPAVGKESGAARLEGMTRPRATATITDEGAAIRNRVAGVRATGPSANVGRPGPVRTGMPTDSGAPLPMPEAPSGPLNSVAANRPIAGDNMTSGQAMGANTATAATQYGGMYGAAAALGVGALAGGTMSYMTGGSFTQGAVMGAGIGGGMGLGMKYGAPHLGRMAADSFAANTVGYMQGFNNAATRRVVMGSGALLGGTVFGGNRSHRRGFNSNRGNGFGR